MKQGVRSSPSALLDRLRDVQLMLEDLLSKAFSVLNYYPHEEREFKDALGYGLGIISKSHLEEMYDPSLLKELTSWEDVAHKLRSRKLKRYVKKVYEELKEFYEMKDSRTEVGEVGWIILLRIIPKFTCDLYGSMKYLLAILRGKNNTKYVHKLQQRAIDDISHYVLSHERDKFRKIVSFLSRGKKGVVESMEDYIKRVEEWGRYPHVDARGKYDTSKVGQAYLTASMGETVQPNLLLIGRNEEDLNELIESLSNLPIKKEIKDKILKGIKQYEPDDLLLGHPLNVEMLVGYVKKKGFNLIKLFANYYAFYGGRLFCLPMLEYEGIMAMLFPANLVGKRTFWDPRAINLKLKLLNVYREFVGLDTLPSAEQILKDVIEKYKSRYYPPYIT